MKKILLFVLFSTFSFAQGNWDKSKCGKCAENPFKFDKSVLLKMERIAKIPDDYDFSSAEKRKRFVGAILLKNESENISTGTYIKFSSLLETDKFIMIGELNDNILIQNLKSKLLYVVWDKPFNYMDYSRSDENGYKTFVKKCPPIPSASEQELLTRYKALIKSANTNIASLLTIQKKYLTRGYFDASKVSGIDKKTYNTKLDELKEKAKKLADIDSYEDRDNKAQDKLTTAELGYLSTINDWNYNVYKLN